MLSLPATKLAVTTSTAITYGAASLLVCTASSIADRPWALPSWPDAVEAVRELVQARPGLSMVRLSTVAETRTLLAFAMQLGKLRFQAIPL